MLANLTPLQQKRRENILESAIKEFSSKGFYNAEIETIAKNAGVGKGTIYRYFRDKNDLLIECVEKYAENVLKYIDEKSENIEDPIIYFETIIDSFIDYFQENPRITEVLLLANNAKIEDVVQCVIRIRKRYFDKFIKKIQKGVKEKVFLEGVNEEIALRTIEAGVLYIIYTNNRTNEYSISELKNTLKKLFLYKMKSA